MFENENPHTREYLTSLFGSVNRLTGLFYDNTLGFHESLKYIYVINTICSDVSKILKNNENALEHCLNMSYNLKALEREFEDLPQFKHMIRSILIHNDLYINRLQK